MNPRRRPWQWLCRTVLLIVLMVLLAGAAIPGQPARAQSNPTYFPQYGHFLGGMFRAYWEQNGGVDIFGYPITDEYIREQDEKIVQYFERARFELGFRGSQPVVELGWIGQEYVEQQGYEFEQVPPFVSNPESRYFPETGHSLQSGFKAFWESHNGAVLFGAPISEEISEVMPDGEQRIVQYFQRARFELHVEGVRLGTLGLLLAPCQQRPPRPASDPPPGPLPEGSSESCEQTDPDQQAFALVYPEVSRPGTVLGFDASGYRAGETVALWLNLPDGSVREVPYGAVADENGSVLIGFQTMQADPTGEWSIVGQGVQSGRAAVAVFWLVY